ncbi:hypothetical protein SAMN02927923_02894 [Microvirga guangxiensis]|uniref:Uncharacterized protein n=2 Tax=Microvirga guangxiensis TaxID=549386 RepID=A0A1G5JZ90_9HYPH|nr:hypothetical protein SAMN02927923_02894 [Microvirga guangxiensis]
MARVRGLKDIKMAVRWIASARGTRDRELALWNGMGVNVHTRSTWYVGSRGDEAEVLRQAGNLGAYVLVERMTWAAQANQRGLEVLVPGDPVLRTNYASALTRDGREEAVTWHDWLLSDAAQAVIAEFSLGGVRIFTPENGHNGDGRPPRT